jgi:DNA-directed RNA polymerase specialized sigma24 family protein
VEQSRSSSPRWDREVCDRLVAGDQAALGELYDEFSPLVYGLAARVTRDWAAAEDITQDVFVRVWEDPRAFDPARGTWRGWLGTITHRRAVDWVRRSVVRSLVLAGPAGGDWTIPPAPTGPGRPPDATVTMEAVEFCYLLGNRRDPDSVPHTVEGDPALAATLLRAATTLGCD